MYMSHGNYLGLITNGIKYSFIPFLGTIVNGIRSINSDDLSPGSFGLFHPHIDIAGKLFSG